MYEHKCMENINKLYKSAGICENQQHYKSIILETISSTLEGLTNNIMMSPVPFVTVKKSHCKKITPSIY